MTSTPIDLPVNYGQIKITNPWTAYYGHFSEIAPPKKQDFMQTPAREQSVLTPNMKIKNNLDLIQLGKAQAFEELNKYNRRIAGTKAPSLQPPEKKTKTIESKSLVVKQILPPEKQKFLNTPQGARLRAMMGDPSKVTVSELFNRVGLNTPQGKELNDFIFGKREDTKS